MRRRAQTALRWRTPPHPRSCGSTTSARPTRARRRQGRGLSALAARHQSRPASSSRSPATRPRRAHAVVAAYAALGRALRRRRPARRRALVGRSTRTARRVVRRPARDVPRRRAAPTRSGGRSPAARFVRRRPRARLPPRERPRRRARRAPPSSSSSSSPPTPPPSSSARTRSTGAATRWSSTRPSGLGESIVGGTVTPDAFVVGRGDLAVRAHAVADKRAHDRRRARRQPRGAVPGRLRRLPSIDDDAGRARGARSPSRSRRDRRAGRPRGRLGRARPLPPAVPPDHDPRPGGPS